MKRLVTVTSGLPNKFWKYTCIIDNNLFWKTFISLQIYRFSSHRYNHYKWVNWCNTAMLQWQKLFCLLMGTFYKNFYSVHVIQSLMTNLVFSAVCDGVTMAGLNCFSTLQTHQGEACRKIGVVKSVKYRCEEAQGGNLILIKILISGLQTMANMRN